MPALKKFLAFSLPVGLALVLLTPGQAPPVRAAGDSTALESPAELRLTALDTLMKGDKHSAVDLFEEAIRLATLQFGSDSTFLGDLYYEAGRLYLELDQFNQAEDYLRQAVKINPKNASARLALARLLDTRAKVQESIGQIREALMINPGSPVARYRFVQTLSKYGQSPSDKAIVTQESYTVAMMQKAAREAVQKPVSSAEIKANKAGKNIAVPSLPKNLVPLKDEEDNAFGKGEGTATKSDTAAKAGGGEPRAEGAEKPAASSALSLFPLKNMGQRKEQEQEQRDKEAKAQAEKKAEEEKKKTAESDVVQKLKEQLRQHEKARASERAEREELARQARAAKAEARAAKEQAKVETKPVAKPAGKPDGKGGKPDTSKAAAKPADKPTQAAAEAQPQQQQQPVQQMMPQQMMPQQMYMPPMYPQQMFSPPPKGKPGKGFVPPPPPTIPMYPGMMQPVVPQVIPAQQAKPAAPKPKAEKPKPAEAKPVEDKPPPMASPGEDDPNFLLDWGELKKDKAKKKGK